MYRAGSTALVYSTDEDDEAVLELSNPASENQLGRCFVGCTALVGAFDPVFFWIRRGATGIRGALNAKEEPSPELPPLKTQAAAS